MSTNVQSQTRIDGLLSSDDLLLLSTSVPREFRIGNKVRPTGQLIAGSADWKWNPALGVEI
jgi:hypothetical protein